VSISSGGARERVRAQLFKKEKNREGDPKVVHERVRTLTIKADERMGRRGGPQCGISAHRLQIEN